MAYCSNCGKELDANAVICIGCGCPVNSKGFVKPDTEDKFGCGWALLGFFVPIAGLILYIMWKSDMPKRAKSIGLSALISVILQIALIVAIYVIYFLLITLSLSGTIANFGAM